MPLLSGISENSIDTMTENISRIGSAVTFIDNFIAEIRHEAVVESHDSYTIQLDLIEKYPSIEYVLFELTRDFGLKSSVRDDIITCYRKGANCKNFSSNSHTA